MSKIMKEYILKDIRLNNKDIDIIPEKLIVEYIVSTHKCSKYLAKQITKELTHDRK